MSELMSGVPGLQPEMLPNGHQSAVFSMTGDGTAIELLVPDDVQDAAVQAVIDAHTNPPPPDRTPPDFGTDAADLSNYPTLRAAVGNLRQYVGLANPTAAQSAAALKLVVQVVLAMLRRMI